MRLLQKTLAEKITSRVHGQAAYKKSVEVSSILFNRDTASEIKSISEEDFLMVFEGVEQYKVSKSHLIEGIDPVSLLTEASGAFKSKGEIRRLIQSNAVSINKIKCKEGDIIQLDNLLNNKYLLIQKGKKHYIILCFE